MLPKFKNSNLSDDTKQKLYQEMKTQDEEVKQEYTDQDGKIHSYIMRMSDNLEKSLEFWSKVSLPPLPDVFIPDSQTNTSPRSKLDQPVNE